MEQEKIFADGFVFKRPKSNAPDFVKGKLSIKVDDAIAFLQKHQNNGWVNIDLKNSKSNNLYLELDTWKHSKKEDGTNTQQGSQNASEGQNEAPSDPFGF